MGSRRSISASLPSGSSLIPLCLDVGGCVRPALTRGEEEEEEERWVCQYECGPSSLSPLPPPLWRRRWDSGKRTSMGLNRGRGRGGGGGEGATWDDAGQGMGPVPKVPSCRAQYLSTVPFTLAPSQKRGGPEGRKDQHQGAWLDSALADHCPGAF